jgi:hypothetical protein
MKPFTRCIGRKNGIIFKIDFKKAHEKVSWSFVQQTLCMKGFSPMWCRWVASFMEGGHVGIKINDTVGQNFQTKKGVRQGINYHQFFLI